MDQIRAVYPELKGEEDWSLYRKKARSSIIERQNFGSTFRFNGEGIETVLTRHDKDLHIILTEYIEGVTEHTQTANCVQ